MMRQQHAVRMPARRTLVKGVCRQGNHNCVSRPSDLDRLADPGDDELRKVVHPLPDVPVLLAPGVELIRGELPRLPGPETAIVGR